MAQVSPSLYSVYINTFTKRVHPIESQIHECVTHELYLIGMSMNRWTALNSNIFTHILLHIFYTYGVQWGGSLIWPYIFMNSRLLLWFAPVSVSQKRGKKSASFFWIILIISASVYLLNLEFEKQDLNFHPLSFFPHSFHSNFDLRFFITDLTSSNENCINYLSTPQPHRKLWNRILIKFEIFNCRWEFTIGWLVYEVSSTFAKIFIRIWINHGLHCLHPLLMCSHFLPGKQKNWSHTLYVLGLVLFSCYFSVVHTKSKWH